MILAGGNDQVALIEELRRQIVDVYIILVDMNPSAKAVPYADKFLEISTMDREAVLQAATDDEVDMILTACGDQPLSTMTYVSEKLGLPCYLTNDLVRDLTNKKYMKRKMSEYGIPTSKFITLKRGDDFESISPLSFPLVVKPVDSNGSKGVKKVSDIDELKVSMEEAFRYSLSGDIIIEEFNEGPEISIDAYIEGGKAKVLSVIELCKIKENYDSFTIVQSFFPPSFEIDRLEIENIAQKIADAYELQNTPLLIQAIQTENGIKVVEFSARMGGGSKFRSIMHFTGVDIMKVYVEMVLGGQPKVTPVCNINNASMCYIYCNPGRYTSIYGLEDLEKEGVIDYYYSYKIPGSEIVKSNTSSDRVAGFMVSAESQDELMSKIAFANQNIRILDDQGNDIMKHNLYRQK